MSVPTIGFFITDIEKSWTIPQWRGVVDAARDRGVNLVTFVGRQLHSPFSFDRQANSIYRLAASAKIDGLVVWTAGLVNYLSAGTVEEVLARYAPTPIVSVEGPVDGVPSVLMDDFGAMRSMIEHLIEIHGCRRIAYVLHATNRHYGNKERYRAYRETLAAHDISIDPALISPRIEMQAPQAGILSEWMAAGRVSGWDAIVGHNVLAARLALHELRTLDVDASHRIAVVGFDDDEESAVHTPPLTVVRPPFREMGRVAVDLLLDRIAGKPVPAETTLQGALVIRRSCGCPDLTIEAAVAETRPGAGARRAFSRLPIRKAAASAIARHFAQGDQSADSGRREALLSDFFDEVDGAGPHRFLQNLERLFVDSVGIGVELADLQAWITILRRQAAPLLSGERLRRAENLWQQARVMISEATVRQHAFVALQLATRSVVLRDMEASIISTLSVPNLMTELVEALPRLGIHGCFLAVYDDPRPDDSSLGVPDSSRLMLALEPWGTIHLPPGGQVFPSRQIIPSELWPHREPINLLAEPLFFRENQLGYVLFELGPKDGALYESLRVVISSALQGALQAAELREKHRLLQEEMERRRFAEDKLAHEASHDSLTNLPNRRFFLEMLARALARARRNPSVRCAVLYLDLNKFKMTNDQYGHSTGDDQLVQVAKRLRSATREGDTVARVGGDEFALLLENVTDRQSVLAAAQKISDRLSAPYELPAATQTTGVSIGCVIDISGYERIDDVMADADAAMYRAKANGPSIQEAAR